MANALEETRNLMPGRGHANWSLSEDVKANAVVFINKGLKKLGFEAKADTKGESGNIGVYKRGENHPVATFAASRYGLMVAMAPPGHTEFRKLSDSMQRIASSFKESMAGAPGAFAIGEPIEEAMKVLRPVTKEEVGELRRAVKKIAQSVGMNPREVSVKWINKKTVDVRPPHPLGAPRTFYEKVYKYLAKNGWGMIGGLQMPNWPKGGGIVASIGNIMKLADASESVAGAPGAFAISDAPPPTMQDQVADLLDRVRNPRWEYPSWALPKVALDEMGMSGPSRPRNKKQMAWNQAVVKELEKLGVKTHSLDWHTINYLYHQNLNAEKAAYKVAKIASRKEGLDEEGRGAKWDAACAAFDKARDYATAVRAMKSLKSMAAGQDDSHYANAISHRVSRLRKLKARG